MKRLVRLILLLALAIGLALLARYHPTNVSFFVFSHIVEMNRNLAIALLLLAFLVLYALIRVIRSLQKLPARVASYRRQKAQSAANHALRDAIRALFEGRFVQAEKSARLASSIPDNAAVASLIGARSAHAVNQPERREEWLARAREYPDFDLARLMVTLQLAVERHDYATGLDTVQELTVNGRRHIQALRLALRVNQQAKNWTEVLRLVRQLDKHGALDATVSEKMRALSYSALFAQPTDAESVQQIWNQVPPQEKLDTAIARYAAQSFLNVDAPSQARQIIEQSLNHVWAGELLALYRRAIAGMGTPALLSQIDRCEQWAARIADDGELHLTLGVLCLQQQLWGKAQRHLERALAGQMDAGIRRQAHLALGRLHTELERPELAAVQYRLSAEAGAL